MPCRCLYTLRTETYTSARRKYCVLREFECNDRIETAVVNLGLGLHFGTRRVVPIALRYDLTHVGHIRLVPNAYFSLDEPRGLLS